MRSALVCVFFFKQKTAYEMRISDWSSDVCSSDLPANFSVARHRQAQAETHHAGHPPGHGHHHRRLRRCEPSGCQLGQPLPFKPASHRAGVDAKAVGRSEEHTSELQSLMRISYAVFCLKKKKSDTTNQSSSRVYKQSKVT